MSLRERSYHFTFDAEDEKQPTKSSKIVSNLKLGFEFIGLMLMTLLIIIYNMFRFIVNRTISYYNTFKCINCDFIIEHV